MTTQTEAQRLALALSSTRRWNELTDDDCDKAAAELRRLESEIQSMDRLMRASVPPRWKSCKSPVGAVQSYIAELEAANAELLAALKGVTDELLDVLHDINNYRIPFDGDEFHDRLEAAKAAIKKHGGAA